MGIENLVISITPEPIFHIKNFPITNTTIITLIVSVIIIAVSFFARKRFKLVPKGAQNVIETVIEALLGMVDGVTGDRKQTKIFFPLVATIFIFVILINWVELIPGLGTIGIKETHHGKEVITPFIRSSSADLNLTLAIAFVSVFSAQFAGIAFLGIRKYLSKFFVNPFKKPYFVGTFVGVLELISECAKIISFSFRLFGNIFAGEVLLLLSLFLVPYFFNLLPLPFLFLELFVGFIQALVFSMLTLVFLKSATIEH
ncbi:MAG: F0F1 ATP synthase subunit A [Patescibacteria group bacterium]|nr:F0F1 ATP synthase subunit A [Patescibacteria group bacterium]